MSLFGSGTGGIGTGIVFSLKDQFSNTADRIRGKFGELDAVTDRAARNMNKSMNRMKMGFAAMAVGAVLLAPIGLGISKSIEMSDALSDVTKTTNITGKALQDLRSNLESLDTRTSIEGLLEMARAGGTMGVAQKDIASFTSSVDKLNVALGDQFTSPEVLARDLSKMRNVLLDIKSDSIADDLLKIGNVLNYMGANAAATEVDIASVVGRMAGLGQSLGMTSGDIFGVSTALLEMGVNAEVAGTNFPLTLQRMAKDTAKFAYVAGVSTKEFEKMVNTDIVGALNMVSVGAKKIAPTATEMAKLLDGLGLDGGRVSEVFLKLASNTDLMKQRVVEANKALTNTDSIMAEFNAKNTNLAAVVEKLKNKFNVLTTHLGDKFAPAVEIVGNFITMLLEQFRKIIDSPIGGAIVILTGVTGTLLLVVGALVSSISLVQFMSAKAALSFAAMGKAEIAAAFASKGLIGGLRALTASLWAAMAPLWPWLLAGAALIGLFLLLKKSFTSFSDVLDGKVAPATDGWLKILQRLGGVMQGVAMIWSSSTRDGFTLTEKMRDALQSMGILDFVLNLGTWIVRMKGFFRGLWQGIKEIYSDVKTVFSYIGKAFDAIGVALSKLGFDINKNSSNMNQWEKAGKTVAYIIGTIAVVAVVAMTVALWNMAVAVISATWPILLIIAAIALLAWGIYELVEHWDQVVAWMMKTWGAFVNWMGDIWNGFVDWLFSLPEKFYSFGKDIVMSIWDGIKSVWNMLQEWFMGMIEALIAPFKSMLEWMGILDGTDANVSINTSSSPNEPTAMGKSYAESKASQMGGVIERTNTNTNTERVRTVQLVLPDGRVLAEMVNDENDMTSYRKNG